MQQRLILEWLGGRPTKWQLNVPYYEVPQGFVSDLTSIPKGLRFYLSKGEAAPAAVLHDYRYHLGEKPRKECDQLFRKDCVSLCQMRPSQAAVLWGFLRAIGWVAWRNHRK